MSRGPIWTHAEDDELLRLRDVEHLDWDQIAPRLAGRRTVYATKLRYYKALSGVNGAGRNPRRPGRPRCDKVIKLARVALPPVPAPMPVVVAAPIVPAPLVAPAVPVEARRRYITDALREAAELRSRIALQGLTAGLLGDPLPGRSALDERLARLRSRGDG